MNRISHLYALITQRYQLTGRQEMVDTEIPGVRYFHSPNYSPRTPVAYEPGIVIIGTGRKIAHLDGQEYIYHAGQHLLLTVPLALECETIASEEEPLQGIFIELDLPSLKLMIDKILQTLPNSYNKKSDCLTGIERISASTELLQIQQRLLETLQSPLDAQVLGKGIVDELIYRILLLPQGQTLFSLMHSASYFGIIAKTINLVQEDLAKNYTVDELAGYSGMSVSAFHRAFKQVTLESPLQYIKKMKLFKAKALIVHQGMNVSLAALYVGYESASQFSREFKRLFDVPPSQADKISYAEMNQ